MKTLKISGIANVLDSVVTGEDTVINSVSIDSRTVSKDGLYIAIKGDKFDGNDFTDKAFDNGCAAAIVSKKPQNTPYILVKDTRKALIDLARYYRQSYDIPVVGLTGSVGKTTTKEMTCAVLKERYNTIKTQGNLNNDIGLPRTILTMDENTEAAVIEMGMSHMGEISLLTSVALPTIAIITNIGLSHMENLGSRENICKAKLEILEGLKKGGAIMLNGDDPLLVSAEINEHNALYYGINNSTCDFKAENIKTVEDKTVFSVCYKGGVQEVTIPTIGIHNVYNALAAFGVGIALGLSAEECANGLSKYEPTGMRQRVKRLGGIVFVEDCYNASPDSQRAAMSVLKDVKANRRIAVLGDMLELGTISEESHIGAGLLAAKAGMDMVFTFGERSKATAEKAKQCGVEISESFTDKNKLAKRLFEVLKPGDAVLFKASRGMKLEEVMENLYNMLDK